MAYVAVLEEIEPLPGAQRELAALNRYRNRCRSQRRPDVARHVIGTFGGVSVGSRFARDEPAHEVFQIGKHIRIGILLND